MWARLTLNLASSHLSFLSAGIMGAQLIPKHLKQTGDVLHHL